MAKKKKTEVNLFQGLDDFMSVPLFDFGSDDDSDDDEKTVTESVEEIEDEPKQRKSTVRPFNDGTPKKTVKPPKANPPKSDEGNDGTDTE